MHTRHRRGTLSGSVSNYRRHSQPGAVSAIIISGKRVWEGVVLYHLVCVPFHFTITYPAGADDHIGIVRVKLDAVHSAAMPGASPHPRLQLNQQLLQRVWWW